MFCILEKLSYLLCAFAPIRQGLHLPQLGLRQSTQLLQDKKRGILLWSEISLEKRYLHTMCAVLRKDLQQLQSRQTSMLSFANV